MFDVCSDVPPHGYRPIPVVGVGLKNNTVDFHFVYFIHIKGEICFKFKFTYTHDCRLVNVNFGPAMYPVGSEGV